MDCFTLSFLVTILVRIVIIIGVVAIIRIVLPALFRWLGAFPGSEIVLQIITIVIWIIVVIAIIYFVYDILICLPWPFAAVRGR